MRIVVRPSQVRGTLIAPASKSAMQRACAAALIKGGKTILYNPGISNDDKVALNIIQQLGAIVETENDRLMIRSDGRIRPRSGKINCGESGLSVRMFTSIAALSDQPVIITGEGSLLKRPLAFFNEVFPQLEVQCQSNGSLPLQIKGPLQPKNIEVDGSLSSQFLTGLLFAYAAAGASDLTIKVKDLNSKPYVGLTLKVMSDFGLKTPVNNNYEEFYFPKKSITQFDHSVFNYTVEGDWSSGAFLLVAGANAGNITVKGLDVFSTQADKNVLQALMQCGANLSVTEEQIEVRQSTLKAFHFNATDCPDLFPPLVALAAYCEGTSAIEGVHRLLHKESNRAKTLQSEFNKMGIEIKLQDDLMLIKGGEVRGATVSSHHDHRIAMACAVTALKGDGEVTIENAEAVNKSYPQFWEHLQKINAGVSLINS